MKKYVLMLVTIVRLSYAVENNLIDSIRLEKHKVTFIVNKELKDKYLTQDFFVQYQEDIDLTQLDYSIVTMPLIMNIVSVVWISGNDYYIDTMDKDLFESLKIVHEVFKRFYPNTQFNGKLIPKKLVSNNSIMQNSAPKLGVVLPFSQGLDSVCTSMRYYGTPQLLLTVRGFPDVPLEKKEDHRWEQTKKVMEHYAVTYGHTNCYVKSNFHDFFNKPVLLKISPEITHWRINTVEDLGWIGLAAPILVTKGYRRLILPGNGNWSDPQPIANNPIITDNVSFAGVSCKSDAFELIRPEKSSEIVNICTEHNLEKPLIWVCVLKKDHQRKNCCQCQKCVITILSFLLAGENPQDYGFDIETTEFFEFFKHDFIHNNTFKLVRGSWYKYCQDKARAILDTLNPKCKEFFRWYNAIDFDKLIKSTVSIAIDYNNFTDLYNIPLDVLNNPISIPPHLGYNIKKYKRKKYKHRIKRHFGESSTLKKRIKS